MAKTRSAALSVAAEVREWMNKLDPELRSSINAVRKTIKTAVPQLNERIKWNAPSYYYKRDHPDNPGHFNEKDILTFGPTKGRDRIILVFHHPGIVKIKSGLLQGNYKDRRLVYLNSKKEIKDGQKELERIIKESVQLIDNS